MTYIISAFTLRSSSSLIPIPMAISSILVKGISSVSISSYILVFTVSNILLLYLFKKLRDSFISKPNLVSSITILDVS